MLLPRVIPCLDVDAGRVVKGVRFQGLRDAGDPVERASAYAEQGGDELVLLDVSATHEGRETAAETVRRVRAVLPIPLTVGGGIRTVADAERMLSAGADKIGINSAAVARPELLSDIRDRLGAQCTILALDAARMPATNDNDDAGPPRFDVVTHGGRTRTGTDAIGWARAAVAAGAGEILLTSWDRDGTRSGYDLELLRAVSDAVPVPVIASGGAAHAGHLAAALDSGASAVLIASMLHDGDTTVADVKRQLRDLNIETRP